MRRVVLYQLVSLDGVAERPNDFITDWDEAMQANLGRVIAEQDTVVLGRRTYDEWAAFWPGSTIQPFSSFINGVRKYVLTSTTPQLPWAHTTVTSDPLGDLVTDLKGQPGGDIGVHGSISLSQSLLRQHLVDELRLVIAPQLMASGRTLFESGERQRLELTQSAVSPTGYLLVDYRVRHQSVDRLTG